MTTTYRLHVSELSPALLDSIKTFFKNKTVEITVTDAVDETEYLLSNEANKRHLLQSMQELNEGKGIELSVREFLEKYGSNDADHNA